ncbi:YceD family protein [Sedimentibacter sp. MB31-C6]|uniref:YceD family protein n=1 Tax=Sedimentibacter sp. MB31-C6 TaxID=3109366 RepID=UPI002DDD6F54|nr:DUF177 domain-containing protein [Sedimentibacter sp. MB36-C1]WSI04133.1 DUF177 domain-containing protein [Sedimentibacter sp. MB36-C1]
MTKLFISHIINSANKEGGIILINLSKFLSSNDLSLNINEIFQIEDKNFLEKTHLDNNIYFKGSFFKVEDDVLLNGIVKYTYSEECARCLTEFNNAIETKFEAVVVNYLENKEASNEIKLVLNEGCVELEETIKQLIYLSMPMKALCKEDCKGICPTCGANLNNEKCKCDNNLTDPRFDKLKDLLND